MFHVKPMRDESFVPCRALLSLLDIRPMKLQRHLQDDNAIEFAVALSLSLSLSLYQAGETRCVQTQSPARRRAPAVRGCLTLCPLGDSPPKARLHREALSLESARTSATTQLSVHATKHPPLADCLLSSASALKTNEHAQCIHSEGRAKFVGWRPPMLQAFPLLHRVAGLFQGTLSPRTA